MVAVDVDSGAFSDWETSLTCGDFIGGGLLGALSILFHLMPKAIKNPVVVAATGTNYKHMYY